MSAYGCMECGFSTESQIVSEHHEARRPVSCSTWRERQRVMINGYVDSGKVDRCLAAGFSELDQELDAYWENILPAYR